MRLANPLKKIYFFIDFYCIAVYNKTIIHVYNYAKRGSAFMRFNMEDAKIIQRDDTVAKSIEDYMLDLLYNSAYMEY